MELFHHMDLSHHIKDFLLKEASDLKKVILQKEVLVPVLSNHHKDIHLKVDILPNMEDIKISQFQNLLMNIL